MPPVKGKAFRLMVDDGTDFIIVSGMNNYSKSRTRQTETFDAFEFEDPAAIVGEREHTYTVSGMLIPGDPGQAALLAAEAAGDSISIQALSDGTKGFQQDVKVNSFTHDATTDGFQEISFEFTGDGAQTAIAAGDLL